MATNGSNATSVAQQAIATAAGTTPLVLGGALTVNAGSAITSSGPGGALTSLAFLSPPSDPSKLLGYSGGVWVNITPGTGLTIDGSNNLDLTSVLNDISGSGTAIVAGDAGKIDELGAFTYTLAQAGTTGFGAGWGLRLANIGASDATVNAITSVFTGASGTTALVIRPNCWADISSDGANYKTQAGCWRNTIPFTATYTPGINPNDLPIGRTDIARTITAIKCRPEVLAGGAATIKVFKAASGTLLTAGTELETTACNANSAAGTTQDMGVSVSTLAAGDTIGLVTTGTTVWTSSGVASGLVEVDVQ